MAKADFEKAKREYPSTQFTEEDWVQVLHARSDIMWAIVGDVYNVIVDERERDAGKKRIGRRPFRSSGSIDEVYEAIFPQAYTNDPFPLALKKLIGSKSQAQFAAKVPCDQGTISRLLSGDREPDMVVLRAVAAAAKVSPAYFVEYRILFIVALIGAALSEQPNLSITAYKRIRGAASE